MTDAREAFNPHLNGLGMEAARGVESSRLETGRFRRFFPRLPEAAAASTNCFATANQSRKGTDLCRTALPL